MPFAKSSLGARFEALEFVVWDEGESCAGEAAAMDPAGAPVPQQILRHGQQQGDGLGAALPVVGHILQIHEGGAAGLADIVEKGAEVAPFQGVALQAHPAVVVEEVVGPQHGPVPAGGPHHGQVFAELSVAHIPQYLPAKAGGHLAHLLGDGVGLAVVFKEILCEFNTLYGIEHGYLSPIDACQVNLKFDLGTVQYREDTGDYDAADIARVMSGTAAGIAEAYTKNARGQTIIFAPSIEEGKNVTALLNSQHGASTAAFIDGTTQNRGHFLEAYRLGLIKVLVCYAVLTEGVDLPMTETVVLARPIARTNVGLYAQMVGRGLRLYPGKASCKVIDCVGVSNMPICTAATLIGKDVPAPKPEKEPTEKLPEEQDPIKVLEGNEIPDSWIKNQKEVNVMALGEGYTTHDVAWLDVKGGGRILPLPNVVYRISKPLPNGMVYLRKNKKCSRCAVPLQFVLDYVYQDLKQNHPQQQHIWDKKQRYKWDRQPITSEQISLIHKLAPDYKIDTKKMTRGDASRVIQLLAYAPKEQDAQEQAQEVQDDAT